ncbi:hypothetical protein QEM02_000515 [Pseudomonas putida]|nr:hypothetical protein [Pseudomonas putida]
MTEKASSPIHEVSARIDKWQEGQYGLFGYAKVLSADPPAAEAIYFVSAAKAPPALGEPFDCSISVVKGRWRVIALASEREPVEQALSGVVLSCCGSGMKRSWRIELDAPAGEASFATLTTQVLRQAKVAHLESGQPLSFMALPSPSGDWSATKVLTPLAAEAITDHAGNSAFLALALANWTTDTDRKTVAFAVNSPPSKVWPLVYVRTSLLFKQSIRAIRLADPEDASAISAARATLLHATHVLQCGSTEELAGLSIDCLQLALSWDAGCERWNCSRLLAPLRLREPNPGEVIDWVSACVTGLEAPATAKVEETTDVAEPCDDDEANGPVSKKTQASIKVWMDINDPRVGRGNISGYFTTSIVTAAGLAEGVTVVVRIGSSTPPYWNAKRLHRSTPLREDL